MSNKISKTLAFALIASQLSACSTIIGSTTTHSKFEADRDKAYDTARHEQQKNSLVNHVKGIYVDTQPIKVSDQKANLLETFSDKIVIGSKSRMTIQEIADRVTKLTRIPVNYSDTLRAASQSAPAAIQTPDATGQIPSDPLPGLLGAAVSGGAFIDTGLSSTSGTTGFPTDIPSIDAEFSGKLTDFLDHVAGRTGMFWKYDQDDKRIVFYKFDTKVFPLNIMPGSITSDSELTNIAGSTSKDAGSQSTSKSGQSVKLNIAMKAWEQTVKSIEKMLSKDGRIESNETIGSLAVTDTPMVLATIGRYVDQINKSMSRQVAFDVVIYDVEIEDDNKLGIDWNFVWKEMSQSAGVAAGGQYAMGYKAASQLASSVQSGASFLVNLSDINKPLSSPDANGSTSFVRALETQGRLSLKTHQQTMTLNNTPVPIKVTDETTYLASASTGTTAGGAASTNTLTTTLEPGKVVSGVTMTLLPHIFDANQMTLQMALDIADLKGISTITSGSSSIQAPRVGQKSILQRVALKNNETLIMSGFDQDKNSVSNERSMDIPGGLGRNEKHVVTVIMITPRITDGISSL